MTFDQALAEIRTFWLDGKFPFPGGGGAKRVGELEREFDRTFPDPVREYVARIIGPETLVLDRVGNPIELYASTSLSKVALGYNFNPVTNEQIDGWSDDWLLIGDEGADPIVVELHAARTTPVLQAMHGAGDWEFSPIADSLPQFILLATAFHHAMQIGPTDPDDRITDDDRGFNLNETSAEWLFPRIRQWAPAFYEEWLSVFDNS